MHAAAHILGDNGEACMQLYNILTDYHNYSMIVLHVSMKMMLMQSDILWLYIFTPLYVNLSRKKGAYIM